MLLGMSQGVTQVEVGLQESMCAHVRTRCARYLECGCTGVGSAAGAPICADTEKIWMI
jgi:hypothetical protein